MEKRYLVWIDILGFNELAKDISEKSSVIESKIRDDLIFTVNNKIRELENKGLIIGKNYGGRDDWLLVVNCLDLVFHVVTCILDHNTGYKYLEKIPLEIGIGFGLYNKKGKLDGKRLITESSTINFIKTDIVNKFRNWYKKNNKKSIKSSFIVMTESVYKDLNPLDKEFCRSIKHNDSIFFNVDLKKFIQRGNVFNFLELIKKSRESPYSRIDTLFVPPKEYEEIIQILEKNNIVFLVGDPEIGKTFTAVRILWEYFCKGYEPFWHFGSEYIERKNMRQIMSEYEIPSNNKIIYLEDPFGKIIFEDREELRREIGNFILKIKSINSKVIVTSRSIIFSEFEKKKISETELFPLKIDMLLMKPSYSYKKMKQILINWANMYDCKWLAQEDTKNIVIKEALNKLTTPLSLRDFTLSSIQYENINDILLIINNKSKEVKKAFAEEIIKMDKEKVLFLSLTYILFTLEKEKIENIYYEICKKFELDYDVNSFDYLEEEFKYKINRTNEFYEFTHPSYEEGLVISWNSNELKNFFRKIIHELIERNDPKIKGLYGFALTKNLSELSFQSEAKNLIISVLNDKNPNVRNGVAIAAASYFNALPLNFGLELIEKISNDRHREIRAQAINIIIEHYDKISKQKSLEIITKGLDDRAAWVRLAAIRAVMVKIEDLPKVLILKALECCEGIKTYSGWFISYFGSMICWSLDQKVRKFITQKV